MNSDTPAAFFRCFQHTFKQWRKTRRTLFALFSIGATLWVIVVLAMLLSERKRVSWGTQDRSRSAMFTCWYSCLEWLTFTPDAGVTYHNSDAAGWRIVDSPVKRGHRWMPRIARIKHPDGASTFVVMPLWIPAALFGSAALLILLPVVRAALRHAASKCVHCGYDIRQSQSKCPECGKVLDTTQRSTPMPESEKQSGNP